MVRNKTIDVVKGIGIIFVILGHMNILFPYCFSFHMQLFFFVSGFLFFYNHQNSFKKFVSKKFFKLVVPYFLFGFFTMFLFFLLGNRFSLGNVFLYTKLLIFDIRNTLPFNSPLWFLISLFTISVIYFVLTKYIKSKILIFITCLSLSYFSFYFINENIVFSLNWTFYYLIFYAMGDYINHILHILQKNDKKILKNIYFKLLSIIIILFALIVNLSLIKDFSLINRIFYSSEIVNQFGLYQYCINVVIAICGIITWLFISRVISNRDFLFSWIGKNSLIIFANHIPILMLCGKIFGATTDNLFFKAIIYITIIMVLSIPISHMYTHIYKKIGR